MYIWMVRIVFWDWPFWPAKSPNFGLKLTTKWALYSLLEKRDFATSASNCYFCSAGE